MKRVRSYKPFYFVTIKFPALSEKTKKEIDKIFLENPFALASLRSGFMSEELIKTFEDANIELISSEWDKLKRECSCPDYGDPCKHMAAVFYILAKEIDFEPRLIFQIAGYDLASTKLDIQTVDDSNIEDTKIKIEQPSQFPYV